MWCQWWTNEWRWDDEIENRWNKKCDEFWNEKNNKHEKFRNLFWKCFRIWNWWRKLTTILLNFIFVFEKCKWNDRKRIYDYCQYRECEIFSKLMYYLLNVYRSIFNACIFVTKCSILNDVRDDVKTWMFNDRNDSKINFEKFDDDIRHVSRERTFFELNVRIVWYFIAQKCWMCDDDSVDISKQIKKIDLCDLIEKKMTIENIAETIEKFWISKFCETFDKLFDCEIESLMKNSTFWNDLFSIFCMRRFALLRIFFSFVVKSNVFRFMMNWNKKIFESKFRMIW